MSVPRAVRAVVLLLAPTLAGAEPAARAPAALWDAWPAAHVSPADPHSLKHADLVAALKALEDGFPGLLDRRDEALSAEGRPISLYSLGSGPRRVLLWSQMHGDEPTATSALLDVIAFLGATRKTPATERLLSRLTLLVIPMLNPDGAERTRRVNAQGIDINRDALRLSTPEGRFLKSVRDRFTPEAGYNLHNLGALTTAGPGGAQVAISLLAVPFDEAFTENEGRRLTKRLALTVRNVLEPWAKGKVARYDVGYTARAFGDSLTLWGTPTLLIESGGWNGPDEQAVLVRLNFVALLGSLQALADGSLDAVDPAGYDAIPVLKRDALFDVLVRNATILNGLGLLPFVADVGIVRPTAFTGTGPGRAGVVEVDDLTAFRGKREIDAAGLLLAPAPPGGADAWTATVTDLRLRGLAGDNGVLALSGEKLSHEVKAWMPRGGTGGVPFLAPGFGGDLLLFESAGEGRWRLVERLGGN